MGYGKGLYLLSRQQQQSGRQAGRQSGNRWGSHKATSNCHIIKSAARATIIQPQQAVATIVAGRGLGLARFAADLKHLRFLPTQFTLITDFRHRDNIAAAPQRCPKKHNTHISTNLYRFELKWICRGAALTTAALVVHLQQIPTRHLNLYCH